MAWRTDLISASVILYIMIASYNTYICKGEKGGEKGHTLLCKNNLYNRQAKGGVFTYVSSSMSLIRFAKGPSSFRTELRVLFSMLWQRSIASSIIFFFSSCVPIRRPCVYLCGETSRSADKNIVRPCLLSYQFHDETNQLIRCSRL